MSTTRHVYDVHGGRLYEWAVVADRGPYLALEAQTKPSRGPGHLVWALREAVHDTPLDALREAEAYLVGLCSCVYSVCTPWMHYNTVELEWVRRAIRREEKRAAKPGGGPLCSP